MNICFLTFLLLPLAAHYYVQYVGLVRNVLIKCVQIDQTLSSFPVSIISS